MKVLTLTQPWATLVAIGAKRVETRSWTTNYRGPLAIHAAKGFPGWARETCGDEPFMSVLATAGYRSWKGLPIGAVLCTVRLVDVRPTRVDGHAPPPPVHIAAHEEAFGDYTPGRFAWFLDNLVVLSEPVPATGSLGLWDWNR